MESLAAPAVLIGALKGHKGNSVRESITLKAAGTQRHRSGVQQTDSHSRDSSVS